MPVNSHYRGHVITHYSGGEWVYADAQVPVSEDPSRPCGYCKKACTRDGHDGCLGELRGVMNACCGHGDPSQAYVQYLGGETVRGPAAVTIQRELRERGAGQ